MIELTFRPWKKSVTLPSQNERPLPEPRTAPWKAARSKKNGSSYRPAVVLPPPLIALSWPVQPLETSLSLRYSLRLWTPIPFGEPKRYMYVTSGLVSPFVSTLILYLTPVPNVVPDWARTPAPGLTLRTNTVLLRLGVLNAYRSVMSAAPLLETPGASR